MKEKNELTAGRSGWKKYLNDARPFLALAVLLIACMISNENFRSAQNLLNITRQVACTGIAALGMTLVIIAGGIDLSVGSLLALSGVSAVMVMGKIHDPQLAVAAAMLVSLGVGTAGGVHRIDCTRLSIHNDCPTFSSIKFTKTPLDCAFSFQLKNGIVIPDVIRLSEDQS